MKIEKVDALIYRLRFYYSIMWNREIFYLGSNLCLNVLI